MHGIYLISRHLHPARARPSRRDGWKHGPCGSLDRIIMASLRRRITVGIRNIPKIYGPYIQYEKFKSDPEHWNSSAPKIVYLPPGKFPAPAGPGSERLSIGRGRTSRYIFYNNGRKVVRAKSFEFWSSNRPFHHLFSPHAHGDIISHNSQWRDATLSLLALTITAQRHHQHR